jgi:hypothetical protein
MLPGESFGYDIKVMKRSQKQGLAASKKEFSDESNVRERRSGVAGRQVEAPEYVVSRYVAAVLFPRDVCCFHGSTMFLEIELNHVDFLNYQYSL